MENESVLDVEDVNKYLDKQNSEAANLFLPAVIYTSIMMVLGVIGNGLTLIVYFRYITKHSTKRLFIIVLAICDFISCCLLLPALIAEIYYSYTFTSIVICKSMRYLFYLLPFASVFTLLLISLERYRKICHPLRWQITLPLARRLLHVLTIVIPAILASPAAILNGHSTIKTGVVNLTGVECHTADEFKRTSYPLIYNIALLSIALIGAVFLFIAYSLIWRTTWRHIRFVNISKKVVSEQGSHCIDAFNIEQNFKAEGHKGKYIFTVSQKRCSKTRLEDRPSKHGLFDHGMKRLTHIMFAVTLVYIISFVPHCIYLILNAVIHDFFTQLSPIGKVVYQLMSRSFMISYCANPLIYGFIDKSFREACKHVFWCDK